MEKPTLTGFMFFNDMQNGNQSSMNLIDPLNVLKMPFIPNTFSFVVSFGFANLDITKSHSLQFILKDPDKEIIVQTDNLSVPPMDNNQNLPIEAQGYQFNLNLRNVVFKKAGQYIATIHVDSVKIGEFPCYVAHVPQ